MWYYLLMLYTGKGDAGTTKFFDTEKGKRVSKNSCNTEALGALDEVNSFLGLCKAKAVSEKKSVPGSGRTLFELLEEAQENLFIAQAEAAGAKDKFLGEEKTKRMEDSINAIEKTLPPITGFSIAGGTELSSLLDVARTLVRKTERTVVSLHESGEREIHESTRAYLNRLSSLLFAFARLANHWAGVKEKNPSYK